MGGGEGSLEVNPHSGAAHFELGWLYDEKVSDPAAAIYHYQQYLKYNPKADNAPIISQRINSCKQQLAANALELPSTPAAQQQLEHLVEQNRQLQQQVDQLNGVIKQWNAYYASLQAAQAKAQRESTSVGNSQPTSQVSTTPDDISAGPVGGTVASTSDPVSGGDNSVPTYRNSTHSSTNSSSSRSGSSHESDRPRSTSSSKHSHTVQSGETLASIARKAGVSLESLKAANPSINPKKLRAGQTVIIP